MVWSSMAYENILYSVENKVAKITMNRPDKLNAMSPGLTQDILAGLKEAEADNGVKAIVLTGAGRAFCAGGDISGFGISTYESGFEIMRKARPTVDTFMKLTKPLIGAVNGFCMGVGFSYALLCDYILASDKAVFSAAFVNVGLAPDGGMLYTLPHLVGMQKAKEIALLGEKFDGQEACRIGIANQVVEHEKFEEAVKEISEKFAGQSPIAMRYIKGILNRVLDMSFDELMENMVLTQGILFQSEDTKEAVDAFQNKRKPNFK